MFLFLLTMPRSQADESDWENMTNKELHDKFQQMMSEQVQDVLNNFEEAMEKITGLEKTSETSSITDLMNCLRVFHHRLHLPHLCNNNNNNNNNDDDDDDDYLHVAKQTSAERAMSFFS